jgi:hypothetical protein
MACCLTDALNVASVDITKKLEVFELPPFLPPPYQNQQESLLNLQNYSASKNKNKTHI